MRDCARSARSEDRGSEPNGSKGPFGIDKRPPVDLGPPAVRAPDEIGLQSDDRVASAHRTAFDRFEQEAVMLIAGEL